MPLLLKSASVSKYLIRFQCLKVFSTFSIETFEKLKNGKFDLLIFKCLSILLEQFDFDSPANFGPISIK